MGKDKIISAIEGRNEFMRVLLIGNAYSIHVCNFIQYTLANMSIEEIVIFHILGSKEKEKDTIKKYYEDSGIRVIPQGDFSESYENIVYHLIELKKLGRFDVCHLFSLKYSITTMGILMRPYCDILISNYWGSDWLRAGQTMKGYQEKLLKVSDYIVTDSLQIYEQVDEYFKKNFSDKMRYIRYKLPVIEELKNWEQLEAEKKEMARKFGILESQLVVTCGYSSWRSHKQLMVIDTIKKIPREIRKKIFVLIPAGYGYDKQNIADIKNSLADIGTGHYVVEEFMEFKEVAALRSLTDIFINMQPTDAYSSTILEYSYCKKAVFCNASLDYSKLEAQGAYYEKINDFEQLEELLIQYINNYDENRAKFDNNRIAVEKFQGDTANNKIWEELYDSNKKNSAMWQENTDDILQEAALYYSKNEQTTMVISSLLERTVMMEEIDKKIAIWLKTRGYQKIGIYGIGHLGRVVYFKLKRQNGIKISAYDMNTRAVDWFEYPVLEPDAMGSREEDVIIITPALDMGKIKERYQDKITVRLITVAEWLDELD